MREKFHTYYVMHKCQIRLKMGAKMQCGSHASEAGTAFSEKSSLPDKVGTGGMLRSVARAGE